MKRFLSLLLAVLLLAAALPLQAMAAIVDVSEITGIEIVSPSSLGPIVECTQGYWTQDAEGQRYYEYNIWSFDLSGLFVRIDFANGSNTVVSYLDGQVDYNLYIGSSQSENHWTPGGENRMTVGCFDFTYTDTLPVVITESPVERIEIENPEAAHPLRENAAGRWEGDTFYYESWHVYTDLTFRVSFKDGRKTSIRVGEELDGGYIDVTESQYNPGNPWVKGGDNYIEFGFLGKFTRLQVEIVENPVASIEILNPDVLGSLLKESGGEWRDNGGQPYYHYYLWSLRLSELQIRINYKNGGSDIAYYNSGPFDGYEFVNTYESQDDIPWTVGGDNYVILTYCGCSARLPINIIESNVAYLTVEHAPEQIYIENIGGDTWYDDNGEPYYYYWLTVPQDVQIRIHYNDGTPDALAYVGEYVNGFYIGCDSDQNENHWLPGKENYMYITYMDKTVPLPITLVQNTVEWIAIENPNDLPPLLFESDGYWDEWNGEPFFRYWIFNLSDIRVRIHYADGREITAHIDDEVDGVRVDWYDDQYMNHWTVGSNNYITVEYFGKTALLPVTVLANPVDRIEILNPGDFAPIIENMNGEWETDQNGQQFFYYTPWSLGLAKLQFRIYFNDGRAPMTVGYNDYVDGYSISYSDDQYQNHWTVGADNRLTFTCRGRTAELPVTVIENPVASIEIENPQDLPVLYEGIDGYWDDWSEDEPFFYYDSVNLSNIRVKINYKDGRAPVTASPYGVVDGYSISYRYNQSETHWTVGSENYIEIEYLGKTTLLPVTVAENPVASITLNSAPTREYVWGDTSYGWSDGDLYELYPNDLTGLSFTVHYKTGGSKTYTWEDIHDYNYIDGHEFSLDYDWSVTQPGPVTVTFGYMGCTLEYTVNLAESPVSSVEIVRQPDKTHYAYGYGVDFAGMQVKINYKTGATETVAADAGNLVYTYAGDISSSAYIEVDGYQLQFYAYVSKWEETTWLTVDYLGAEANMQNVLSKDFEENIQKIDADQITPDGKGMVVTVYYKDGSSDTFTIDPIEISYSEATYLDGRTAVSHEGCTRTEKGMVWYQITTYYNQDGSLEHYDIRVFSHTYENVVYPDALPGDLDGDGRVEADDLVDLRQALLKGEDPAAADVNGDGTVDVRDLVALKKQLANAAAAAHSDDAPAVICRVDVQDRQRQW